MKKPVRIIVAAAVLSAAVCSSAFCQGPPQQIDPPTSFFGVLFSPRPSRPQQPMHVQMPAGCQPAAYAPVYSEAPPAAAVVEQQRIVYVPYACPPPIYIERGRHQKNMLPLPLRNPLLRSPDAYLQEYPEMPQRMYTTRGPRDFLAPNPPGIGE
ncbi:MAG: hypothetical protein LBT89_04360 [Planctomycetaceae bacterium]|nr:hypothetical protein [Planctomycetaceae bacterium]